MGEIIDFPRDGYRYYAKAVLDSLCEGEDGDLLIQVESISMNKCFEIVGATLDRETKIVNLQIK